ncbi:MAG: inositol monophosphatase [Cyclobacteriaceae bacterium]|nr:inositol monophosphatase [Cyclobacteriaceae bacterium]
MKLTDDQLIILSNCAISAAYKAGHYISRQVNTSIQVETKVAGESLASQVFTQVDLESQRIITETLAPTLTMFDLAMLAEESVDDGERLKKDYFWCIDPLDGTLPFIHKEHGYAVSIALVSREGIPQIGVIYDPLRQQLHHASKGKGAWIDENPRILPVSSSNQEVLKVFADRSFLDYETYDSIIATLHEMLPMSGCRELQVITGAGAAINACMVLDHEKACYFKFPRKQNSGGSLWDYAATACIYGESGSPATDIHGNPLDLNRSDSTFMNHRGILFSSNQEISEMVQQLYKKLKNIDM